MFVSKRVLFFKSKRNGWMLFCGNSNSFYQIEDKNVPVIQKMFDTGDESCLPDDIRKEFIKSGVLLNETDGDFFERLRYKSFQERFRNDYLMLTIAPTMACNFKCVYCYEGTRIKNEVISDNILDKIVEFIQKKKCKSVYISWYGGEPLCAWNKIVSFNEKLKKLELTKISQDIVTNGSLLTTDKLEFFLNNNFTGAQVTLDGFEETHNKHRPMKNGQNSFLTIIKNLDDVYNYLNNVNTSFSISIRINIDKDNEREFYDLYNFLNNRYNKKFQVYPAFVTKSSDNECHVKNCLNFIEESKFILDLANKYHLEMIDLLPKQNRMVMCGAQVINNYVIDPFGDMYKCWEDIRIKERKVGNILTSIKDEYNTAIKFIMQTTGFEQEDCKNCLFLYSCCGGCPRIRLNNIYMKKSVNPICAPIKSKPEEFFETYFEYKQNWNQNPSVKGKYAVTD